MSESPEQQEERYVPLTALAQVLEEFVLIFYKHDPMDVGSEDITEYEGEALSTLTRMHEAELGVVPDDVARTATRKIVKDTLEFWFDGDQVGDLEFVPLCDELVNVYFATFKDPIDIAQGDEQEEKDEG